MFSEIKNRCFNKTQIQPLSVKLIHVETKSAKIEQEQKKHSHTNNKLISSYEEDYTRNNTEIMKLWQRN